MEVEIRLHEFLDKIKEEFELDSDMSAKSVLSLLRDELSFRERLLDSVIGKIKQINTAFGSELELDIEIHDLDDFKIFMYLDTPFNIDDVRKLNDLNLHYLFSVKIYPYITLSQEKLEVVITLNKSKLDKIRRYL